MLFTAASTRKSVRPCKKKKKDLDELVCDFLGSSGAAETAERSSVLPTAHAAAANQQCPTAQLGCCATGNNKIMSKETLQKKPIIPR